MLSGTSDLGRVEIETLDQVLRAGAPGSGLSPVAAADVDNHAAADATGL
jgi:hypothetical protein